MDRETAEVILLSNLKGTKRKPSTLLEIAEACRTLIREHRTVRQVAEAFGVSVQQIVEFNRLLDLPPEVQDLFRSDHTGVSKWYELSKMADSKRQIEAASYVKKLGVHDTRGIVDYARRYPDTPVETAVQRVSESKKTIKKVHVMVVAFDEATFIQLKNEAIKQKVSIEDLVSTLVKQELNQLSQPPVQETHT